MERNRFGKTTMVKKEQAEHCSWFLLDASGKTLGRLASEIAKILRGKHKTTFTPHVDTGDGVIVMNAEKVHVTGAKEAQKIYRNYTGFIGGMRETPYRDMMKKNPTYILKHAVKGMMPRNRLARKQMKKLRIFVGDKHIHQAQQPISINL